MISENLDLQNVSDSPTNPEIMGEASSSSNHDKEVTQANYTFCDIPIYSVDEEKDTPVLLPPEVLVAALLQSVPLPPSSSSLPQPSHPLSSSLAAMSTEDVPPPSIHPGDRSPILLNIHRPKERKLRAMMPLR
ncbi:hypothetical protein Fot_24364 [Forsythia ovata]|uniref:Uncharacterized protein n=1 Tax=Forsythia ovata TaxID=205694 RepID=A0ABD1U601_9LAMI